MLERVQRLATGPSDPEFLAGRSIWEYYRTAASERDADELS
jgi:hypothetical protein